MGSIGFSEIFVVALIALIILGPDRLPDAAREVGKWYGQFKRLTSDLQGEVQGVMDEVVQPFNAAIQEGLDSGTATGVTSQAEAHEVVAKAEAASDESKPEPVREPPALATPGAASALPLGTGGGALAGMLTARPGTSGGGGGALGGLPTSADDVWAGLGGRPTPALADASPTDDPAGAAGSASTSDFDPSLN